MKLVVGTILLGIASQASAVALWGQCGGLYYTGSKICDRGSVCVYSNDWYSQCLPSTTTTSSSRTYLSTKGVSSVPTKVTSTKTTSSSSTRHTSSSSTRHTSSSSTKTTSSSSTKHTSSSTKVTSSSSTRVTSGSSTKTTTTTTSTSSPTVALPTSFEWSSSGVLISPKNDSHNISGIKDPSIIYYNGVYHVFASTAVSAGYNLVYLNFTDFDSASSAPFYYLDATPIGTGYRAAPQVFYFAPQSTWYLVYQNGNAAYSTNSDISNPNGWTAPKTFYSDTPAIITANIGSGYWVDMWVICDSTNCHLFSSDDNGHLYRSQTSISNFPNGMSEPVIALSDSNPYNLFEASNVYKVNDEYLLIVEAIGSDGRRYFRSWTSSSIAGNWTGLADTEANPFARANNVAFSGTPWTQDISHGEMVRTNVDQTMSISPCNMRYLYQGEDPSASGDYNSLPWRLGLLTQTNSPCGPSTTVTGSSTTPSSTKSVSTTSTKVTSTSSTRVTSTSSTRVTSTSSITSTTSSSPTAALPTSFEWSSSGILISPKNDSHNISGIKDPSIVYYNGLYHVFASTAVSSGYNLVYLNFADFDSASSAPFYYLDATPIGTGYRAAPQVFYFAPQSTWYLVYQNGNAAYSTNSDISNPNGWTAPQTFYSGTPAIITANIGSGYWVDMWVICDSDNCHLFSSDDNGHLYRSQTSISDFPNGMSEPVIALSDSNPYALFEASNVYKVNDQYLLIVEAIGSDGRRYFRSWTSSSIAGNWTGLADTEANPFARSNNVAFSGTPWTQDISHGEMVRTNVDQTLSISPCNMRYLYQGEDPNASGDYNSLPWRLALLTQTNSPCGPSTTVTGSSTTPSSTKATSTSSPISTSSSSATSTSSSSPALPTSFEWSSSGILISPKSDSHNISGIKDPSIIYYDGVYHVFASTAVSAGYNLVYLNFTDFDSASSAPFYYLDSTPIGTGYRAAPQVFYFAPTSTWYLIYQNGNAAYSTNSDISNPNGWTAPKTFYSDTPAIITANIGSGYWVDMWVICDSDNCHLFSSDDNGHLYRSQTSISDFPNGMSEPVIALSDSNPYNLFEASNVYKVGDQYLLIVEAIGSDGRRYFRSWTSSSISGTWTGLANTESNPFARSNNVAFSGTPWTQDISHGEMVRTNVDQTMSISPCNMRYLYQGEDPNASGDYNSLPWRLALLTQTNSPC